MKAVVAVALLVAGCGSAPNYDPAKNAEFRRSGRELVSRIDPVCRLTRRDELYANYEPVLKRFAALKRNLSGSPLAIDLAVVEADEAYERSVVLVECSEIDGPNAEHYLLSNVKMMTEQLGRMETIAQKQGIR